MNRMLATSALAAMLLSTPATAQGPAAKPLFASDQPLRLVMRAPFERIINAPTGTSPAVAGTVSTGTEDVAVTFEPRGLTRRAKDICQFPPLRLRLSGQQAGNSLFAGQRSLKLVAHCRSSSSFQKHVLLEYAAYKLFNRLTPRSFNVRLALIDYQDSSGKSLAQRYGFFIEDIDDVAKRNGMKEAKFGRRFPTAQLSAEDSARFAVFEYMIGNLDWAMNAGPSGDDCCHNSKPMGVGGASASAITPVPYDFDFSGFVNAPYATAPAEIPVSSVRQRRFRGLCRHNAQVMALLPSFRAQRGAVPALLASIPGLDGGAQRQAAKYLDGFFSDIATDEKAQAELIKDCRGRD